MIQISNLSKKYASLQVLSDINLAINKGEIFGIIGESGAGKSTLLRCINGLESYDDGSLIVDGTEVKHLNNNEIHLFRKNIGIVFQNFALLERKTVYENISLPIECWPHNKGKMKKRVEELIDLVGLSDKKDSKPSQISGGQKQRVAIARALALEPKILLCDEATSALDPATTDSILNLLLDINKKLGITIVTVTHEMSVIKSICDRMSIMEKGRIVLSGSVEKVFLDLPKSLKNLLGYTGAISVPGKSVFRFSISGDDIYRSLMYSLAVDYNVRFNIVSAQLDDFKGKKLGHIYVCVDPADIAKLLKFYADNSIECFDTAQLDNG